VSVRATVLDAGGNWVGYTDPTTGELTNYGLPLHWWDGSAWQKVARTADGDATNGYDHVFVWTGVTWVPWSSQRYASVGTVVQGTDPNDETDPPLPLTLSFEVGQPVVFVASYGAANAPAPDDVAQAPGQPYASPSWPTQAGGYGNGGNSGMGCAPGWDGPGVTQPVDVAGFYTTIRQSDDPTVPTTAWRTPIAGMDRFGVDAAYIVVPVGLVGVSRIAEYYTTNCYDPADAAHRYFPGLTNAASVDGLLLRMMTVWDQTAPADGLPGEIPTPDGHDLVWQGTQLTGPDYINGQLGMRMAVFSQPVPAGTIPGDVDVELGAGQNGEAWSVSILFT